MQQFTKDADVTVDEELVFLSKMQTLLSKHQATSAPLSVGAGKLTQDTSGKLPAPATAGEQQSSVTSPVPSSAQQSVGSPVLGGGVLPRRVCSSNLIYFCFIKSLLLLPHTVTTGTSIQCSWATS